MIPTFKQKVNKNISFKIPFNKTKKTEKGKYLFPFLDCVNIDFTF